MVSVPHDATVVGLDVHKVAISASVLKAGADSPVVDKIATDPRTVKRLIGRFADPRHLVAWREAGPTGHELARQLRGLGVRCEVIAASIIPVAPGDQVRADGATRGASLLLGAGRSGRARAVPGPSRQGL